MKKCGFVNYAAKKSEKGVQWFFYQVGKFDAEHPILVIVLSFALVGALMIGFINFEQENREERLWVPGNSEAVLTLGDFRSNFNRAPRFEEYIATGTNVINKAALLELLELHDKIVNTTITVEGEQWNFTSLCLKDSFDNCILRSILSVWDFDEIALNNDPDVQQSVANAVVNDTDLKALISGYTEENGRASGRALFFSYTLENREVFQNGDFVDLPATTWEEDVFLALTLNVNFENFELFTNAEKSFGDEFSNALSGDLQLLGIGYFLIISYVLLMFTKLHTVKTRVVVPLCGILSIGMGVGGSFGLASAMGFFYAPVQSVLPFLLLGIGVDDMFIIVNALDCTNPKDSSVKRVASALSSAGAAITVTSLTDLLAFAIGSITVLPALSSFCKYASIGVALVYLLQVTLFTAILALDTRRQKGRRRECCCCSVNKPSEEEKKAGKLETFVGRVWHYYAEYLLKWNIAKVIVIFVFIVFLGIGIYGVIQTQPEFDPVFFLPSDSYALEYSEVEDSFFQDDRVPIFLVTREFDHFEMKERVLGMIEEVNSNEFIESSVTGWFIDFEGYLNRTNQAPNDTETWHSTLSSWLLTEGARYSNDITFQNGSQTAIRASRMYSRLIALTKALDQVDATRSIRNTVDNSGLHAYPYSFSFLEFDQYAIIQREILVNLLLALAAVFIVTVLLLGNLFVSVTVFVCVLMTLIDIFGVMWLWSINLDVVSVINLVLAVGIAVDYSTHIGHAYLQESGSNDERIYKALVDVGGAVLNGAVSTFLAVLVLAFSKSFIFQVFFRQFFSITLLGVLHALVLLPVVLSLIGPKKTPSDKEQEADNNL